MRSARGIPHMPVLYTVDQIAAFLSISTEMLRKSYLWRVGEELTPYRLALMRCMRISDTQEWRVPDYEFERWLTFHNLYVYDARAVAPDDPAILGEGAAPQSVQPEFPTVDPALPPDEDVPDDDLLAY